MTPELITAIGQYIVIPICGAAVFGILIWKSLK